MDWKIIQEFTDYQISNTGQVRNKFGKILIQVKNKAGYPEVRLFAGGKSNRRIVHRLVAQTFIENPLNKPTVNHKNGIRDDNRIENLEWCSWSENIRHSFEVLNRKPTWKGKFGADHTRAIKVQQLTIEGVLLKEFNSIVEASSETKTSACNISQCISGKRNTAGGFTWVCKTFH